LTIGATEDAAARSVIAGQKPGGHGPKGHIAVVFDMDGVVIESEEVWDSVREAYVRERGGRYDAEVQRALMGMSSIE
jgi:hypothetical protein